MTDIDLKEDWSILSLNVVPAGTAISTTKRLYSFTIKNTSDIEIYLYRLPTEANPFVIYPREWHSFVVYVGGKDNGEYIYGYLRTDAGTAASIPVILTFRT